jgi:hypothetical protein
MNVTEHPMNDLLSRFSYNATPKAPANTVKEEEGTDSLKNEDKVIAPI